jgi:hypothetical protein
MDHRAWQYIKNNASWYIVWIHHQLPKGVNLIDDCVVRSHVQPVTLRPDIKIWIQQSTSGQQFHAEFVTHRHARAACSFPSYFWKECRAAYNTQADTKEQMKRLSTALKVNRSAVSRASSWVQSNNKCIAWKWFLLFRLPGDESIAVTASVGSG